MKKIILQYTIWILLGSTLTACQHGRVQTPREQRGNDDYQPRPAATSEVRGKGAADNEVTGELLRVSPASKTMAVRAENGSEQTFKVDGDTILMGVPSQPSENTSKAGDAKTQLSQLLGKEGSEVSIQWKDERGAKTGTCVSLTEQR